MDQDDIKFGTDGWRAVIADDFTFANLRRVAQGFAAFARRNWSWERGIVVGYDRRFGSERFADVVAEVLAGNNIKAYLVDRPCPTPVAAFSVATVGAAGAAIVTASHNPPADNGFKVRTSSGAAVPNSASTACHSSGDGVRWSKKPSTVQPRKATVETVSPIPIVTQNTPWHPRQSSRRATMAEIASTGGATNATARSQIPAGVTSRSHCWATT